MKKKILKKCIIVLLCASVVSMTAASAFAEQTEDEREDVGAKADSIIDDEALRAAEKEKNTDIFADSVELKKAVYITFENGEIKAEKKDKSIKKSKYEENGILVGEGCVTLDKGTFVLQGEYEGQIIVDAGKTSEAIIVFNNFTLKNETAEAFICKGTESLVIIAAEDSENTIISGSEVEINEESAGLTAEQAGGAIYSKADTLISGRGTINIYGYINNGIQVTKNVTIDGGNINISAVNNGIRVKNTINVTGGDTNIRSGNDGIKAEGIGSEAVEAVVDEITGEIITEAAEAVEDSGMVVIDGGIISIDCYNDGIESLLDTNINGGYISIASSGTYYTKGAYTKTRDKTFSGKGIKAGENLSINNGTVVVKAYNDGLHCGAKFLINDGTASVYCGDDGIHSDKEIEINGGIVYISNSCEGIEGNQIIINGGSVSVAAGDDGMNAYGGNGFGSGGNRSGTPKETPNLIINGGDIYVRASGDGLDSNGNITVNGGYTVVDGPTSTMNGPLDGGTESGGQIIITGGTVFAGGIASMAEGFNSKSQQASFLATGISYKKGAVISVYDTDGNNLFEHTTKGSGQSIVFSCPEFEVDNTYILKIDDKEYEVALNSISTRAQLRK